MDTVELKQTRFDPNAISEHNYAIVPEKNSLYVEFGEYEIVESVIAAGLFFPIFISGLSGNGKTFMVEQAAANANRHMIRVQMSRETDEDDLIGGFRLINGETKFIKGPVIRAMELGALLLIDEADRGDPGKIMCLQGILEGKPYYMKKTGEVVKPSHGFNIIVTANTKGRGSEDGRYVAATILDDSWLERFPITIEQNFPERKVERAILQKYIDSARNEASTNLDLQFVDNLLKWAELTRKSFEEGVVDDVISTRRLVHILETYIIVESRLRAIELCVNRFDKETRNSFIELYKKLDETVSPKTGRGPTNKDPDADKNKSEPAF